MSNDTHMTDMTHMHCALFLDQLDYWLEGELDAAQNALMQTHHDTCAACQEETRLAGRVTAIARTLPELQRPVQPIAAQLSPAGRPEARDSMIARLLAAWREPLVLVPACALLLAIGVFITVLPRGTDNTTNPDLVVVNGQAYTQEEIIQAAEELELALKYLDKYGSYPARVVHTELQESHLPLPPPQGDGEPDSI